MSKILSLIISPILAVMLISGFVYHAPVSDSLYLILAILPMVMAVFSPLWAISGFLFLLPVFGNKPATSQDAALIISAISLQLGLCLRPIRLNAQGKDLIKTVSPYLIVSVLSLFPVSYLAFKGWFSASQTSLTDLRLLFFNLCSILFAAEDHLAYPVKSVILTALTTLLAISICQISDSRSRKIFANSILYGFLLSLVVGLLDFYEILSIRSFRGLDPVVNPEKFAYRLQSWFGHSGWYAEYLTLAAPFVMLFLCIRSSYFLRVALIILMLLLAEFVLILTFQRGGWLSYPITLIAIWAAIYVFYKQEKGQGDALSALKSSIVKILISAPLTVLISMSVLNIIGSSFSLDQYTSRFKDITKASDRTDFMKAAIKLGSLNPLMGQGSESFALQYKREFLEPDGTYHGQINLPLHGTAHGLYAQTFMGKGILGIITFCILILSAIRRGFKIALTKSEIPASDRVVALACSCSCIALAIYGFVQEVFYINALQYLCFTSIALIYSIRLPEQKNSRSFMLLISVIAIAFTAHLLIPSVSRYYPDSYGCYPAEGDSGSSWRWCGLRSEIFINKEDLNSYRIQMAPSKSSAQRLEIYICNNKIYDNLVEPGSEIKPDYPAAPSCQDAPEGFLRLKAVSGNYFIPALNDSNSPDRRVLSLRWIKD